MPTSIERSLALNPPPNHLSAGAGMLSLLVHGLLAAALTWGVQWNHSSPTSFEAELWSSIPQQAAPPLVVPPTVVPTPVQEKKSLVDDADIALQKKKERQAKEQQEEQAKRKAADELKQAKENKKLEKQKQEEEKLEKLRADNLARMMGQADATGEANSTGTAQRASGPSPGYAGRIRARIKPNIVFTDNIAGNPTAEEEVRTAADGTIVGTPRLIKSSGNKAWDDAAVNGVIRTQVLPRDLDGRVPSPMIIEFRPKD